MREVMSDTLLRKELVGLIKKWRKTVRTNRPRGFEDMTFGACARELQDLLIATSELPNEESWVDALMRVSSTGTDEKKRYSFKALLRSYRWAVLSEGESEPEPTPKVPPLYCVCYC
jgi:hypothetical protein